MATKKKDSKDQHKNPHEDVLVFAYGEEAARELLNLEAPPKEAEEETPQKDKAQTRNKIAEISVNLIAVLIVLTAISVIAVNAFYPKVWYDIKIKQTPAILTVDSSLDSSATVLSATIKPETQLLWYDNSFIQAVDYNIANSSEQWVEPLVTVRFYDKNNRPIAEREYSTRNPILSPGGAVEGQFWWPADVTLLAYRATVYITVRTYDTDPMPSSEASQTAEPATTTPESAAPTETTSEPAPTSPYKNPVRPQPKPPAQP